MPLRTQTQLYFFLMFFVVVAIVGTANLMRSRVGRAFIAIRDQDIAAEIIGINIFRYKLLAFAISSFYAGAAGVLYTYFLGIANYEQFQINVSIDYLAMIIIGGLGSVLGSIFGAVFVTLLPIGWAWQRLAFWRVSYERHLSETRVFEGERVTLNLRLTNRKWLPLAWIRVTDRLPLAISPEEKPLAPSHIPLTGFLEQRASLLSFERARWE